MIKTLGTRVTDVVPAQGFSAEASSSSTILASSYFGFSLSTTQVVSGGVMGAGLGKAGGVVHWKVVRSMVDRVGVDTARGRTHRSAWPTKASRSSRATRPA